MKINKAEGAARLFYLLLKLKLLSEKRYDRLVNDLTVRSLKHQLEEEQRDKSEQTNNDNVSK